MSSIIYNGHEIQDLIVNGNQAQLWLNGQKLYPTEEPAPSFDSVTIGSQIWMSKNLAINDGGSGIHIETLNYGQEDVIEYYYTWDAARRVAGSIDGWHLPTSQEWGTLINAVGGDSTAGTKLKSTYGWTSNANGTDDYGFSVFPAGYWYLTLSGRGNQARFWTDSSGTSSKAIYIFFDTNESTLSTMDNKRSYYTIRLVKDSE